MKHFTVCINAGVTVRVSGITADTEDEAANKAMLAVESQLDHIFDRKITDTVETFFSDDIPAIMVDLLGRDVQDRDSPIGTTWFRCDIPSEDIDVFAAIEDVLRTYNQGYESSNPFANEDLKAKMELLAKAYEALPKILTRTKPVENEQEQQP